MVGVIGPNERLKESLQCLHPVLVLYKCGGGHRHLRPSARNCHPRPPPNNAVKQPLLTRRYPRACAGFVAGAELAAEGTGTDTFFYLNSVIDWPFNFKLHALMVQVGRRSSPLFLLAMGRRMATLRSWTERAVQLTHVLIGTVDRLLWIAPAAEPGLEGEARQRQRCPRHRHAVGLQSHRVGDAGGVGRRVRRSYQGRLHRLVSQPRPPHPPSPTAAAAAPPSISTLNTSSASCPHTG